MKTILLGGAALLLLGAPAMAQATTATTTTATTHHRHHAMRHAVNSMDARIDALEAEIHELKAEEAHHAEMAAEPAAAPQPQVTAAQFEALQNQVYEEAAASKSASASTGSGWWDNTKVGGLVFFDLTNVDNKSTVAGVTTKNAQNGFHFDIKRFYLTIDHQFNDVWSAHLTTDATYDTSQCDGVTSGPPALCSSTGASTSQLYIKKAYLEGHFADAIDVRLGSADMPWIPFAESVYGYRYIENTLIDRFKYGNSADWGANVNGSFGDDLKFEYSLSAVNGAGYKKPAFGLGTNRSDGMDFEGRADIKWDGFVLGLGGYDGKLGKELTPDTTHHDFTRFDAIAGYAGHGFNIGLEYFTEKNFDTITTLPPAPTDHGDGWSAFAAYKFTPEWGVFGRYDWAKPQAGAFFQPHYDNRYYNLGVQYSPYQMIDLSLVYKHDAGSNGVFTDQNGAIGGATGVGTGRYNEIGLFGQFKF